MDMSVFDLFKIGIGPSSSHTVGPMVAARRFLVECGPLDNAVGVEAALYGSLALTGVGHATDKAVILGLMGETPQDIDPDAVEDKLAEVELDGALRLLGTNEVPFTAQTDLVFHKRTSLPEHPNGMRFTLQAGRRQRHREGLLLGRRRLHPRRRRSAGAARTRRRRTPVPFPFDTMDQLLALGQASRPDDSADAARERACAHERRRTRRRPRQDLAGDARLYRPWPGHRRPAAGRPERQAPRRRRCGSRRDATRATTAPTTCRTTRSTRSACTRWRSTRKTRPAAASSRRRPMARPASFPAVLRYYAEDCRPTDRGQGHARLHADVGRDRHAVQEERVDLRRRSRLPGRSRRGLRDGGGGPGGGAGRHATSRSKTPPKSASSTTSA